MFVLHKQKIGKIFNNGKYSEVSDTPIESNVRKIINFFWEHKFLKKKMNSEPLQWINQQNNLILSILNFFISKNIVEKNILSKWNDFAPLIDAPKETVWQNNFLRNDEDTYIYKMKITPFLSATENYVFYAREFTKNENDNKKTYLKIKKILKQKFNIEIVMLQEHGQAGNIHNHMLKKIMNCKFMVADLSSYKECVHCKEEKNCNPINNNVLYEIGLAHGLQKPVIIIIDSKKEIFNDSSPADLPFDINSHTSIQYNEPDFEIAIKKILETTIEEIEKEE